MTSLCDFSNWLEISNHLLQHNRIDRGKKVLLGSYSCQLTDHTVGSHPQHHKVKSQQFQYMRFHWRSRIFKAKFSLTLIYDVSKTPRKDEHFTKTVLGKICVVPADQKITTWQLVRSILRHQNSGTRQIPLLRRKLDELPKAWEKYFPKSLAYVDLSLQDFKSYFLGSVRLLYRFQKRKCKICSSVKYVNRVIEMQICLDGASLKRQSRPKRHVVCKQYKDTDYSLRLL